MKEIQSRLKSYSNAEKAKVLQGFFKTGKGQYGEGDVFLGITVPDCRKVSKEFIDIELDVIKKLLHSRIHEERLVALLILVGKFKNGNEKEIYEFYISNKKNINNWDLVDLSADKIVGAYLIDKDKTTLYNLAKSDNIWDRRIAILSTFYFIKNNKFDNTIKISKLLINDEHDLIHKAVGWMLREVGKRNFELETKFLNENYKKMPRTMLRYSIEKFPEDIRLKYLKGII